MKRMIRRWESIPAEEVQRLFDEATPESYASGGLAGGPYKLPYADILIGKSFTFQFDDFTDVKYNFVSLHELKYHWGDIENTVYYDAHEVEPGLFFVNHIIKQSTPPQIFTIVFDSNNGLVTLCHATVGNECEAGELSHVFHFGKIMGYDSYPDELHHFNNDLVGKAIIWHYDDKFPGLKHIYSSNYYYSYVMQFGDACWMASNPADFIKISDHQYIFSFLEERQTGTQGLFLINTETLHDVGCFTGITPTNEGKNHFECYTVGAKGEWSTMHSILE